MTKINKEEYKFLKGLDDKWKWIARDELRNSVYVFYKKPNKYSTYWEDEDMIYEQIDENLFQFIKWEDEEPCSIAELIEEYEYKEFYDYVGWKYAESEEPEVNKDIQWLKREIHKELESWHGVEGGIDGDGINEIMLLINQLDEPEVLSQEWISENVEYAYFDMLDGSGRLSSATAIIKPEKLQNLLVPKREKVKVPRFVADILEENTFADLPTAFEELFSANAGHYYGEDVCKWIVSNDETFARAWLNGYEVEEEPLYRARLKVITDEFIASYLCTQSSDTEDRLKALEIGSKYIHEDYRHLSEFTEDELKRLDIWDSEQWEIEEVEE